MSLLCTSEITCRKSELSKEKNNHYCQKHPKKLGEETPQRTMWWTGECNLMAKADTYIQALGSGRSVLQ